MCEHNGYDDLEASARKYGQMDLDSRRAKARKAGARVKTLLLEGVADQQILRTRRSRYSASTVRAGRSRLSRADHIRVGRGRERGCTQYPFGSRPGPVMLSRKLVGRTNAATPSRNFNLQIPSHRIQNPET